MHRENLTRLVESATGPQLRELAALVLRSRGSRPLDVDVGRRPWPPSSSGEVATSTSTPPAPRSPTSPRLAATADRGRGGDDVGSTPPLVQRPRVCRLGRAESSGARRSRRSASRWRWTRARLGEAPRHGTRSCPTMGRASETPTCGARRRGSSEGCSRATDTARAPRRSCGPGKRGRKRASHRLARRAV